MVCTGMTWETACSPSLGQTLQCNYTCTSWNTSPVIVYTCMNEIYCTFHWFLHRSARKTVHPHLSRTSSTERIPHSPAPPTTPKPCLQTLPPPQAPPTTGSEPPALSPWHPPPLTNPGWSSTHHIGLQRKTYTYT